MGLFRPWWWPAPDQWELAREDSRRTLVSDLRPGARVVLVGVPRPLPGEQSLRAPIGGRSCVYFSIRVLGRPRWWPVLPRWRRRDERLTLDEHQRCDFTLDDG